MVSELDTLRTAKQLLDQRGAQEAWRLLTAHASDEHLGEKMQARDITQQVLGALRKLIAEPDDNPRH